MLDLRQLNLLLLYFLLQIKSILKILFSIDL